MRVQQLDVSVETKTKVRTLSHSPYWAGWCLGIARSAHHCEWMRAQHDICFSNQGRMHSPRCVPRRAHARS
jgi:hypothetical protein